MTTIPKNTIDQLKQLETLNLEENLIESIQPYAFQGLSKLTRLKLEKNKLKNPSPESFKDIIPSDRSEQLYIYLPGPEMGWQNYSKLSQDSQKNVTFYY